MDRFDRDRTSCFDEEAAAAAADPAAILASAREEAEDKVRRAYEEGMLRGEAAGQEAFEARVNRAAEALSAAIEQAQEQREAFLRSTETPLAELAQTLAEGIVAKELETDATVIQRTARKVLEHALDTEHITLRVNPGDLEVLTEYRPELLGEFERIARIEFQPDPKIESGGCVGLTNTLTIDARISEQLRSITQQLLDESLDPDNAGA